MASTFVQSFPMPGTPPPKELSPRSLQAMIRLLTPSPQPLTQLGARLGWRLETTRSAALNLVCLCRAYLHLHPRLGMVFSLLPWAERSAPAKAPAFPDPEVQSRLAAEKAYWALLRGVPLILAGRVGAGIKMLEGWNTAARRWVWFDVPVGAAQGSLTQVMTFATGTLHTAAQEDPQTLALRQQVPVSALVTAAAIAVALRRAVGPEVRNALGALAAQPPGVLQAVPRSVSTASGHRRGKRRPSGVGRSRLCNMRGHPSHKGNEHQADDHLQQDLAQHEVEQGRARARESQGTSSGVEGHPRQFHRGIDRLAPAMDFGGTTLEERLNGRPWDAFPSRTQRAARRCRQGAGVTAP